MLSYMNVTFGENQSELIAVLCCDTVSHSC